MNIFQNRVFMQGDLVRYKGRGGSKRSHENVLEIVEFTPVSSTNPKRSVRCTVKLVSGELIYGSRVYKKGDIVPYGYWLSDLKHVD